MRNRIFKSTAKSLLVLSLSLIAVNGKADEVTRLNTITVIGNTPIHGVGIDKNRLPATVQSATAEDIEHAQSLNLSDYLRSSFTSVTVNDVVNNPYQPDVQYRGFTASPLLGLPQGLSVYVNGMRFNEPFGDTVNWDLFPQGAIDSINLFAGSNPVFGQNTLGGALSIKTKNGFDNPGNQLETTAGSHGQWNVELQSGGNNGEFGYYVIANVYQEDGWRDFSPSEIRQALATLSWRKDDTNVELTAASNDNSMIGNGAAPIDLLEAEGREAIYTQPDQTETNLSLLSLGADTWLNDDTQLAGNLYYRHNKVNTLNGDDSDYGLCFLDANNENPLAAAAGASTEVSMCETEDELEAVEFRGFDDDESLQDVDAALAAALNADDELFDGTLNTSETDTKAFGLGAQLTFLQDWLERENQLTVGASIDQAEIDFQSDTQFAELNNEIGEDRGVSGIGLFDNESSVRLKTDVTHIGLYFTNTLAVNDATDLTVSARYNDSEIDMLGIGAENLDLTGKHSFDRINPALGLTYRSSDHLNMFARYSESSRAPTPAELSCADPDDPCKLPNGFVSDPPLKQVVARSFETGLRGSRPGYSWSANLFHTINHDDIIFQNAGGLAAEGYFANVGKTRRLGLELAARKQYRNVRVSVSYTWMEATFRTPFNSVSFNNPNGNSRPVKKGDNIPGLPEHNIKIISTWAVNDSFDLGAELAYQSSQYYRGDEANENEKVKGFAVLNLRGVYRAAKQVEIFAKIDNVLDEEYETFGTYGESDEVLEDQGIDDHRFVGPGKPRSGLVGVRLKF